MKRPWLGVLSVAAPAVILLLAGQGCNRTMPAAAGAQPAKSAAWTAPDPSTIPPGPAGDSIRLGAHIFEETPKYAQAFVGNRLSCGDCHIQGGTAPWSGPMVGLPGLFPMFNERAKRVISLEDRIQDCFQRSENGRPIPWNGPEMIALLSYIQWLSKGQPAGVAFHGRGLEKLPDLRGDAAAGATVYSQQCAGCHGADGAGKPPILPAVWGPDSYNQGAGMNQVKKMAAFVHHNMPQNHPGTLTPQQAYDVSAYVASKPHSPFHEPGK
ncbi:MAG: c-type cytochrome [Acidobacteria bacterium]|nr:c-type cytochrome [Acidobacteriota bacterium]